MSIWLMLLVFVPIFLIAMLCVGFGQAILVSHQKSQVRKLLLTAEHTGKGPAGPALLAIDDHHKNFFEKAADWIEARLQLRLLLLQAGSNTTRTTLVAMTAGLGFVGLAFGSVVPALKQTAFGPAIPAVLAATLPYWFMRMKRQRRLAKFEEQFPEALNFLSRSMRAGHAFTIGLEMLLADAPDPLRSVFRPVLSNMQLGASLEEALAELTDVVPLIDVRFFISAVLLQQGTGGNLSEILDTMAQIIRDRFQVKGQVKAASAHGRVTGMVLCGMPLIVGAIMLVISPEYIGVLLKDEMGRKLLFGSFAAQLVGFLVIRKMTDIKV